MGVLNVTPDSFSDGGRHADLQAAVAHAEAMVAAGADILDVGGESTRPGSTPVTEAEELDRVLPVIAALRKSSHVALSIDTRKATVAAAAIGLGACLWNDVDALTGDKSLTTAADLGCRVVLMHMQGEPASMQARPHYANVVEEVVAYLTSRAQTAQSAGVAAAHIILDPGIGFGKTRDHNLALIARLDQLVAAGYPVLLGASRKQFIQAVDQTSATSGERLGGSLAIVLAGARAGCAIVRVHDVRETVQALRLDWALDRARSETRP